MITFYKTGEHGLEVVDEIVKNCWISVVDPTPDELTELAGAGHSAGVYHLPVGSWTSGLALSGKKDIRSSCCASRTSRATPLIFLIPRSQWALC